MVQTRGDQGVRGQWYRRGVIRGLEVSSTRGDQGVRGQWYRRGVIRGLEVSGTDEG